MEREDHINKLRNKINSQKVIEDMDALWNELEPRLPKQKKKRKFIFWLPLVGLLFLGTYFSINYFNKSKSPLLKENPNTSSANIMPSKEQSPLANKREVKELNSVTLKQRQSSNPSNDFSSEQNKSTPIAPKKNILSTGILKATTTNNENKNKSSNDANNTQPTPEIAIKKLAFTKTNTNTETINPDKNLNVTPGDEITEPFLENQTTNEQSKLKAKAPIKLFLFPTLEALGINKLITGHREIKILNYAKIEIAEKEDNNRWLVSINPYALADWNFKSQTNLTQYGSDIGRLTSIMPGYSLGGLLAIKRVNGLFFGVGIEYSQTFEKFKLDNSINTTEVETNAEAFLFKGEFIANEQEISKTTQQSVLSYNDYSKINLMPTIGYTISRNINYEIALSPIFNLKQNYSGYLIGEDQLIISDLEQLYKRNGIAFSGYALSAAVTKQYNNKLTVGVQIQYRSTWKNQSDNNMDFELGIRSISPGLKMSYIIN